MTPTLMHRTLLSSLAVVLLATPLLAQESFTVQSVPNPRAADGMWVSDPGASLSEQDRTRINGLIANLEKQTTAEIAVVILPSIGEEVPKDFAVALFNQWGVGKKGKDNGLLLLIVLDQRRWEFETGYGLEGDLPDATLKRIGENKLVPGLRANRMGDGIYDALSAVAEKLNASQNGGIDTGTMFITKGGIGGNVNSGTNQEEAYDDYLDDYSDYQINRNVLGLSSDEQLTLTGMIGAYFFFVILIVGLIYRKTKQKDPAASGWKYVRYTLYWMIPGVLFLSVVYFARPEWLAAVYYPIGSAWSAIHRFFKNRSLLQSGAESYEKYKNLRSDHGIPFIISAVLFPFPMAFFALYAMIKLKRLRNEPRNCPQCSATLERLDEKTDDVFLEEGQRKEEQLGSIDYDVWQCRTCDHVKIFPYDSFFTSYSGCPSCTYKTYHTVGDRTLVSPSCSSSGSGERDYKCEHCGHKRTERYTIPRRDCSKSSSSSGGSSGSSGGGGGSFGGGSSGGGGAGGSW